MKLRNDISIGNLSDVGRERTENQDYFGYFEPQDDREFNEKGRLIIVADGMGGHTGGRTASRLAVEIVKNHYLTDTDHNIPDFLRQAIEKANEAIYQKAEDDTSLKGMGTTCTSMVIHEGIAYIAHVGDSRIYQVRNNQIKQITQDHSWVQQMLQDGMLTPAEAIDHPKSNVIMRSVGPNPSVDVDSYNPIRLQVGDVYLLCSDGLTGLINDNEILKILSTNKPQPACRELVDLANQRGGHDNITVQVVRINNVPGTPDPAKIVAAKTEPDKVVTPVQPSLSEDITASRKFPLKIGAPVISLILVIIIGVSYFGYNTFRKKPEAVGEVPTDPSLITQPAQTNTKAEKKAIGRTLKFLSISFKSGDTGKDLILDESDYVAISNEKGNRISLYIAHNNKIYKSKSLYANIGEINFYKTGLTWADNQIKGIYCDLDSNLYVAAYDQVNNKLIISRAVFTKNAVPAAVSPLIILNKERKDLSDSKTINFTTDDPLNFAFFPVNKKLFMITTKGLTGKRTYLIDFNSKQKMKELAIRHFIPSQNALANILYLNNNKQIIFFNKFQDNYTFFEYTQKEGVQQKGEEIIKDIPLSLGVTFRSKEGAYYIFTERELIKVRQKDGVREKVKYLDDAGQPVSLDRMVKDPDSRLMIGIEYLPKGKSKIYRIELIK